MSSAVQRDYDVIIVGGRVAGSTLAAFLAKQNMRVLLLERAIFPAEHPASSPVIQPVTLSMLDEIGADENAYARNTPKIHRFAVVDPDLNFDLPVPEVNGRNYAYAIDRARFDHALWENALSYETVDGLMGFSVANLLWDDLGKTVIGIAGKNMQTGESQQFTSKLVIGADGRFSLVARKVEAKAWDKHEDNPTSIYYAYWKDANAPGLDDAVAVYPLETTDYGMGVFPSADNTFAVGIEGRSDVLAPEPGKTEAFYLEKLQGNPLLWERLQNAERVTPVRGMKKIGNMFRTPGGLGWALVGDAYHQKDPIDGQGIFDAVFTAKTLAEAVADWHTGQRTWDDAVQWYDDTVRATAVPQYNSTIARVQAQMYPAINLPIPKRLLSKPLKWLANDPQYCERAGLALNRQVEPNAPAEPRFIAIAMLRGSLRELSDKLGEYERPEAV